MPFKLVTSNDRHLERSHIVEVHPAVALWLWFDDEYKGAWTYKDKKNCRKGKRDEIIRELADRLSQRIKKSHDIPLDDFANPSDDELDAYTAWYLADRWLNGDGVTLLGNASTGCFLVPGEDDGPLRDKFKQWRTKQRC